MLIKGELKNTEVRWKDCECIGGKAVVETDWGEDEIRKVIDDGYLTGCAGLGGFSKVKMIESIKDKLLKLFNSEANKPSNRFKESEEVKNCDNCDYYYEPKDSCNEPDGGCNDDNTFLKWKPKQSANNTQNEIDWEGLRRKIEENCFGDVYEIRDCLLEIVNIVKELKENK